MKKFAVALALLAAAVAAISSNAYANTVNFTVTGTYNSSAAVSAFSAPDASIMLSFSLAPMLPSSLEVPGVPVTVSFDGSTTMATSVLDFFSASNGGLFDLEFTYAGESVAFQFVGPQLFNAADDFLLGNFPIAPEVFPYPSSLSVNGLTIADISSGTVAISSSVSATPEPASASLLLLGAGLLGFGMVLRRRQARPANRAGIFQSWTAWIAQRRRAKYS
jgi:hypothetical protein